MKHFEEFIESLKMPDDVRDSLLMFCTRVKEDDPPLLIAKSLYNLEVEDPSRCNCQDLDIAINKAFRWLHRNHAQYNTVVWCILRSEPGIISKLRRVFSRDLRDARYHKGSGKYFKKVKSFRFLRYFLWHSPYKSSEWIFLPKRK